jgi:poly-gamma-glutamate capsule biosynthesis protein CapA/YwtB (metallophosphatase superfamily)
MKRFNSTPVIAAMLAIIFIYSSLSAQIKIKAVGDIMPGSITPKKILPPLKGMEFIESIGNYLSGADLVFGNLEGSIIDDELEPKKCSERSRINATCYEFGIPEYLAYSLKELGFNVLNQDNNHTEDYGIEGYKFTQNKLNELGIRYIPKRGIAEFNFNTTRIAIAAFGYSGNSNNIDDIENASRTIKELDKIFDIIIVSFHGGAEGRAAIHIPGSTEIYLGENRGNVFAFAHAVIDAGADMVIGHGPHVLRAMEIYKHKLIAYSLGNFLTYGNMNLNGINGVTVILQAEIDLSNGDFLSGNLIPVKQRGNGIPEYDETGEGVELIKELTYEDVKKPNILFSKSGKIYNTEMKVPPIRPVEIKINYSILK